VLAASLQVATPVVLLIATFAQSEFVLAPDEVKVTFPVGLIVPVAVVVEVNVSVASLPRGTDAADAVTFVVVAVEDAVTEKGCVPFEVAKSPPATNVAVRV
jgi:hypothetical protein